MKPVSRAAVPLVVFLAAAACSRLPSDNSPEAGFARDMAVHHDQAVEMSFIIRDASRDERLRTLAYDIIVTQSAQRGMFMAWLQQWGLPQAAPGRQMQWMSGASHPAGHGRSADPARMMGMASAAEMQHLGRATGRDAEVLFLQLMIRHHEGGVAMAKAILERTARDEVVRLARGIDSSQAAEIALMEEMLSERGATPLP